VVRRINERENISGKCGRKERKKEREENIVNNLTKSTADYLITLINRIFQL